MIVIYVSLCDQNAFWYSEIPILNHNNQSNIQRTIAGKPDKETIYVTIYVILIHKWYYFNFLFGMHPLIGWLKLSAKTKYFTDSGIQPLIGLLK